MKKTITVILLTTLIACDKATTNHTTVTPAPPPALVTDDYKSATEVFSKRGYGNDLIQNLYNDYLKENPNLQLLENRVVGVSKLCQDSTENTRKFLHHNDIFYQQTQNYLNRITDSLFRQAMEQIIVKSLANYTQKTNKHAELIKTITIKEQALKDLHIALQLITALSMMEKYQKYNLPPTQPLEQTIDSIDVLTKEVKRYIK